MVLRRIAGLLLVVGVLAGCNGGSAEPPPPTAPTPSSSPSESESSELAEPEMPEAAKKPDVAGAKAFTQHFWAMVDYAERTGDTKGLRKLVDGCDRCVAGADGLDKMHADGGRVVGEPREVRKIEVGLTQSDQHRTTVARVRHEVATKGQVEDYGEGDKRNRTFPPSVGQFVLTMVWEASDPGWSVAQWEGE